MYKGKRQQYITTAKNLKKIKYDSALKNESIDIRKNVQERIKQPTYKEIQQPFFLEKKGKLVFSSNTFQ